ncbi:hypothetical protein [Streptomyces specialis]|uniref:hypothetical protein n=1 Tax=Streptomyces specialis TaxID=498367 RepID=UPI00073EF79A|nr:hypothetical protein [Streptomyces specialis]
MTPPAIPPPDAAPFFPGGTRRRWRRRPRRSAAGRRGARLAMVTAAALAASVMTAPPAQALGTVCTVNGEAQSASDANGNTIIGVPGVDNTIVCSCGLAAGDTITTVAGGTTTLTLNGPVEGTIIAQGADDTIEVAPLVGDGIAPGGTVELLGESADLTVIAGDPEAPGQPGAVGNAGTISAQAGTVDITVIGGDGGPADGGDGNTGGITGGAADAEILVEGGDSEGDGPADSGGDGNAGAITGGDSGSITADGGDGLGLASGGAGNTGVIAAGGAPGVGATEITVTGGDGAQGSAGNTGTVTATSALPTTITVAGGDALDPAAPAPPPANSGLIEGGPGDTTILVEGADSAGATGGDGNAGEITGGDGVNTIDIAGGDGTTTGGVANVVGGTGTGGPLDDVITLTAGAPAPPDGSNAGTVDGGAGVNSCVFAPISSLGTVINCGLTCPPTETADAA